MMRILYLSLVAVLPFMSLFASVPIDVKGAAVGIYIAPVSDNPTATVEYNSDVCLTPASVMKAVTSATALSVLGADFRWETIVTATGSISFDGSLMGNVVINGSGDPTLESRFFSGNRGFCDRLAKALAEEGCRSVTGRIVVDDSRFIDVGINPSWEIEDVAWDYGAGWSGVNYRDNSFLLMLPECKVQPSVPGLHVVDRTALGSGDITLLRGIDSDLLIADGVCREKGVRIWCSMPDPSAVICHEVDSTLQARGIEVSGAAVESVIAEGDPESRVVMRQFSPRLGEVLRSLMVRSDNLMAEGALRAVAPGASRNDAISLLRSLWKSRGVDLTYTRILDGSGLARGNAISPRQLGSILRWMARSPMSDEYVALFPRAGLDGTLRSFLAKSPQRKRYVLKTGSMGGVQCYAGYRLDATGKKPTHVVVVMVNNFSGSRSALRKEVERLLVETKF